MESGVSPDGHSDAAYVIAFFPIENQRWLLSYIGVNKEYPPSREDQFTTALANLASPVVHEMVRRMEPISPVYPSRATRNRWRHYERWRRPLGRFIAIADAACCYNPRFGQGMSAAAVSVKILKDCLAEYGVGNPRLPDRLFSAKAISRGRRGFSQRPMTCGFLPPWATVPDRCGYSTGIG